MPTSTRIHGHRPERPIDRLRGAFAAAGLTLLLAACSGSGGGEPGASPPLPPETTEYTATTSTRLSYEVRGSGTGTQRYALVSAPEGMQIDAQTGQVEWVPQPEQIGTHAVTVAVSDSSGVTADKSYRVQVSAPDGLPSYLVLRTDGVGYALGQQVQVSWRIGGELPGGATIELGVQAPEVDAGAAEGASLTWTLGAQGNWSAAALKLQDAARSGQATITLPNRVAGPWTIVTRLLDAAGAPLATAAAQVLVADVPTLQLALNRPIAKPLDRVKVALDLAGGATPLPTRLMAWLVQPDGRKLGLPGLAADDLEVTRADTDSGRHTLLDRAFTADEAGEYRVLVRLYAAADGRMLQEASAKFAVCATPSTVSGRVLKPDRTALDGSALPIAGVKAFDLDNGGVTATAAITGSGSYSLALPAGRYLVSASAIDAADGVFAAEDLVVNLGCLATTLTRDLPLQPR